MPNPVCKTCKKIRVSSKRDHSCPLCWECKSEKDKRELQQGRQSLSLRGNDRITKTH